MKILYAAYRHDPANPDLASGADHNFYSALKKNGFEVRVVGIPLRSTIAPERLIRRIYMQFTGKRYAKFPISRVWYASREVNRQAHTWQPDLVFSIFPPPLVYYSYHAPCVYRQDTSFIGWDKQYPEFGKLALQMLVDQEKRVFKKCTRIITHSTWNRNTLINNYDLLPEQIELFANPSAIPVNAIPRSQDIRDEKNLSGPLRLLFVGRDEHRKGLDIAIQVVNQLNAAEIEAKLTICGMTRSFDHPNVESAGYFKKSVPQELELYVNLYRQAHLLLHPARFDPSPIVTSEAAALATPSITNESGGIATSVADGESGIVLPRNSPPEAYVRVIIELINEPERYYQLCESTRARYERELNWTVAGNMLGTILTDVIEQHNEKPLQ